ncbi:lysozyme inhibitor LprI family protein [Mesorhizobium sp. LHD-90]|uniref:lysozyme inhibitor LprI family protein n=1 Tax=Mesorhizobium sp. LHD-90 TaxID=3071414 RepID=UPI0027DFBF3A|nr:lysozyme inhibitor LprI family protein [Mesorhizobium sp. LHD-90]MDQ6436418.1 lysozyme inhibitor LprI family protein [Mesorhizobium sp. LHD-90]
MRLAFAALAAALLLPAGPVLADECADPQDQASLNICAGKKFEAADRKLNEAYKKIEARLKDNPESRKMLVAAERAWVAFRDAECAFQGGPIDQAGTIRPLVVADCRTGLTEARLKDFQGYLNCEEGDMSCPVPAQ